MGDEKLFNKISNGKEKNLLCPKSLDNFKIRASNPENIDDQIVFVI